MKRVKPHAAVDTPTTPYAEISDEATYPATRRFLLVNANLPKRRPKSKPPLRETDPDTVVIGAGRPASRRAPAHAIWGRALASGTTRYPGQCLPGALVQLLYEHLEPRAGPPTRALRRRQSGSIFVTYRCREPFRRYVELIAACTPGLVDRESGREDLTDWRS